MTRPSNLARGPLLRAARLAIANSGGAALARWHFKYDCDGCGRRVRVLAPNVMPTRARCDACGVWTRTTEGGFDLVRRMTPDASWEIGPGALVIRTHAVDRADATEIEP